jgi:hypothetical protein
MPSYHPEAEKEFDHLLSVGGRDIKRALGMIVERHHRIEDGSEPLSLSELLPGSGPSLQPMHGVVHNVGLADVLAVYETTTAGIQALAFDAWDKFVRVGPPGAKGDARARAWARAS